ncbi:unnamed protein product [Dibothriocephalus latus]|uniref:Dipeptidylpeptidase IV N-terminal domain-containing protein n=1 Tax=Dibothriocephalus latus TaxID=60516 RepID=A0A3P6SXK0_DIBLA|nr:unnamed protein product [Dibothriocephalus latus]
MVQVLLKHSLLIIPTIKESEQCLIPWAFVHNNQLYYIRNPRTLPHEVINVTAPLYTEGILYGFAGFLYEEEILGTSKTYWWSPDSSKLAFTAIDERNVSKTKLFFYEVEGKLDGEVKDHSYPKRREYGLAAPSEVAGGVVAAVAVTPSSV